MATGRSQQSHTEEQGHGETCSDGSPMGEQCCKHIPHSTASLDQHGLACPVPVDLAEVLSQVQRPALIHCRTGRRTPAADPQGPGTAPVPDQLRQLTGPGLKEAEHVCIGRLSFISQSPTELGVAVAAELTADVGELKNVDLVASARGHGGASQLMLKMSANTLLEGFFCLKGEKWVVLG